MSVRVVTITGTEVSVGQERKERARGPCNRLYLLGNVIFFLVLHFTSIFLKFSMKSHLKGHLGLSFAMGN